MWNRHVFLLTTWKTDALRRRWCERKIAYYVSTHSIWRRALSENGIECTETQVELKIEVESVRVCLKTDSQRGRAVNVLASWKCSRWTRREFCSARSALWRMHLTHEKVHQCKVHVPLSGVLSDFTDVEIIFAIAISFYTENHASCSQ